MIFPKLSHESIIQVGDKLRFSAVDSFSTDGQITEILINPDDSQMVSYSIFNEDQERWFIDWAYQSSGEKTIILKVLVGIEEEEKEFTINVISETDDALLSKDSDLFPYEPNVKKYLPLGKSSFNYVHRAAQEKILAYLDEQRIWKNDNSRYTKEDLINIEGSEFKKQFNMWSIFQTLLIIFESSQVSRDDVFQEKRTEYEKEMRIHRNRASLRLDADGDGVADALPRNIRTTTLVRR